MELGPPEILLPHNRGNGCPVVRGRECHARGRHREAVYEVDVVVASDPLQQRILARRHDLIPTHVWHRPPRRGLQPPHGAGQDAEAFGRAFLRSSKQQLHAEADSQHGLRELRQEDCNRAAAQPLHRILRRADPRQHHARRGFDDSRVGADLSPGAESLECKLQRGEVGAAAVNDDRFHYSTPLVLGSSSPSRRMPWRSARPTLLKQPSIM